MEKITGNEPAFPPAEGAKKVQWSGYGELGNISQKPLQPTAEITTDRFRDILNDVQRYIETNGGATESEMKAIWNSLSCAITESERRQPTAEGAEEFLRRHNISGHDFVYATGFENMVGLLDEFAALYAQKIADKMASERLREELGKFIKWYNSGYEQARKPHLIVKEYLKSREP